MTEPIRLALPADAPAVAALIEDAYRGAAAGAGWTSETGLVAGDRTSVALVAALIDDPRTRVLLLEDAAGPLACCELADRGNGVAYLGSFAVRPGGQGGGVGRRVVAEAERRAREDFGARVLEIQVIDRRASLIAWYERLGFVRTGALVPFPDLEPPLSRPLVPGLRFAVLHKPLEAHPRAT